MIITLLITSFIHIFKRTLFSEIILQYDVLRTHSMKINTFLCRIATSEEMCILNANHHDCFNRRGDKRVEETEKTPPGGAVGGRSGVST